MNVDRRRFLVGSAGAVLALPWLESMWSRRANAQALVPPKRFVLMFSQQGLVRFAWKPAATGALPATGDLSTILAPLGAIRDKVTILSGLGNLARFTLQGDNHRRAATTTLTYQKPQSDDLAGGPSIDQVVGQVLQGASSRSSILLPASADPFALNYFFSQTAGTVSSVTPFSGNPRTAAQTLFASIPDNAGPAPQTTLKDRLQAQRGTIVDAVAKNLTSLRARLSAADRPRLDAHADYLHDLSKRFSMVPVTSVTCARPDFTQIPSYNPASPAFGVHDDQTVPAQVDNLIRSFACDITRSGSVFFNLGEDPRFPWLYSGNLTAAVGTYGGWHGMVHTGQNDPSGTGVPLLINGMTFYAEQFTRLVQGLASTVDVDGTSSLLDNTLVVWMTDFGDNNHGVNDIPVIMAGMPSALAAGRYLSLTGGYTTGDLFDAILRLVGAPSGTTFGLQGTLRPSDAADTWAFNPTATLGGSPVAYHKGPLPL
jgi:hypothetical protein